MEVADYGGHRADAAAAAAAAAAPQFWTGDSRFPAIETSVSFKHYQDAVTDHTSKNRVIVSTKERYLRSELGEVLHWPACEAASGGAGADHVLIPDVAFARDFVEFFEVPEVQGLLLGTVLDAMQKGARSRREYARLRACAAKPTRWLAVFHNQHFLDTNVEQAGGESHEQHTTASLAKAAAWISQHESLQGKQCVIVSDDAAVRDAALNAGFLGEAVPSEQYFATRWAESAPVQTLVESIVLTLEARAAEERAALSEGGRQSRHRQWLGEDEIDAAVLAGTLEKGSLQVDERRPEEAWIRVSNDSTRPDAVDLFLPTRAHRGRSVHGDIVAVEPLGKEEWATPSYNLARRDATEEGTDGSARSSSQRTAANLCPTGRVVGVMERTERCYVATIEDDVSTLREGTTVAVLAIPMDIRIPKLRIRTRKATAMDGCRLVCAIDEWSVDSTYPAAHVVRILGPIGDVDVESETIMVECNLAGSHSLSYDTPSLKPFWDHVPRPVGGQGFKFAFGPEDTEGRRDLRGHLTMSIDPPGCVDIDDALSLRQLPNGRMELGVHIADVTHYVPEHSNLDREAFARSTTCYLVDRRLDMLPELLSTNLCSLRGGEDRCAVSVMWELEKTDAGWVAADTWFGRTLIKSAWEGSYQTAQAIIDGEKTGKGAAEGRKVFGDKIEDVREQLRQMLSISMDFRAQRKARGALELHSSEVDFDLVRPAGSGNEGGAKKSVEAKSVMPHATLPVMDMIAEYMIFANSAVAKQIYNAFPTEAALRRHPLPRTDRFDDLVATAALQGITLDPSSNAALAASLAEAERLGDPHVATLLKTMATRAMSEAAYFSTGDFASPEEFYHYGLAAEYYTHFTSPIRRYADVIVHRQLIKSLQPETKTTLVPTFSGVPAVSDQCHHMNMQHRMAKAASEKSQQLFFSLYFRVAVLTQAEAVVSMVRANGIVVYIPKFEFHGSVYLSSKDGAAFVPVGDNTSDAMEDANVKMEFDTKDGNKQLRAKKVAGGEELYSIKVFDHILVNIVAMQSKYHLADVKVSFVGVMPAGGSSRGGGREHRHGALPPPRGKKPGKGTMGALKAAIEDEQEAKEQRLADVEEAKLQKLRIKARLIEPPRPPGWKRRGKKKQTDGPSLYARLQAASTPAAHTATETASLHVSEHCAPAGGQRSVVRLAAEATQTAGRRRLGGAQAPAEVLPSRELDGPSVNVRATPGVVERDTQWTAQGSENTNRNVAKGPIPGQGFTMRRTVLPMAASAAPTPVPLTPRVEPQPALGPAPAPPPVVAAPAEPEPAPAADNTTDSLESGSDSEDLEDFLDSVLD